MTRGHYEGPHGPVLAAYTDGDQVTRAWGPHVSDARLDFGPSGRLDGRRHTSFLDPVAVSVGELSGNAVQPSWALFNCCRRGIRISLGPGGFVVTGGDAYLVQIALPPETSAAKPT